MDERDKSFLRNFGLLLLYFGIFFAISLLFGAVVVGQIGSLTR
jgi:hypothetical protein